jgi:AcrR family transcriptional regulator
MSTDWLDRGEVATERILDATADLVTEHGVEGLAMSAVAAAAGCSRATLYRYFPDRRALQQAYVEREARRVGRLVAADVAALEGRRTSSPVTEGVLSALRHVRGEPALAAWFREAGAGISAGLSHSPAVVDSVSAWLGDDDPDAARWLVRVIDSLLTVPGADEEDERRLVERFVAPVVPTVT